MSDYLSLPDLDRYKSLQRDFDALETAILDICDIYTVHAIQARKKVIMKR
jgi:hypothetical protein